MTEKQKLLLQLFREVDAICKKHDLRYVMAGGTLIGVLRNEGFIPWDDDVDIYMPKSDWDKFVEICQNEMPPNRAVYCAEVDIASSMVLPITSSVAMLLVATAAPHPNVLNLQSLII